MKSRKYIFLPAIVTILITPFALCGEILRNPGLEEDADLNGFPDFWTLQRLAVVDKDPLHAFEGNISVRTSANHGIIQNASVYGGTRLVFSGFMSGDVGGETGALACEFRASGNWRHYQREYWEKIPPSYNPYAVSFLSPPDADLGRFVQFSLFNPDWVSADAFSLTDEFIHNPDFEILENDFPSDWRRVGAPVVDSSGQNAANGFVEIGCDGDHYVLQNLAVHPEKKYKLTGHVRSGDGFNAPESIALLFLDNNMEPCGEIRVPFLAKAQYSLFEANITPPAESLLMRLSLKPLDSPHSFIWFDALDLWGIALSPNSFSPNGDLLHDETTMSILLGRESLVEAEILDPSEQPIRSILPEQSRQKGVHSFSWNGLTDADSVTSPGTYALKVHVTNDLNEEVSLSSPVRVSDFEPLGGWIENLGDFFPRGLWMHLGGFYGEKVDYDSHLAKLKDAGFNAILPNWIPKERIQDLMNAADREGLSVIAHTENFDSLIGKYPDFFYETISETEWRDAATTCICQFASHPSLLGYYIRDEIRNEYLKPAIDAVKTLRALDPEHPAFSSISRSSDLKTPFNAMDTAVLLHHHYPAGYAKPVSPDLFTPFCQDLEKAYEAASEKNRPLWMLLQGFSLELSERLPTEAEMRCQVWLALAYGARGIFYFLSQSTYQVLGVFTYEGEPFPILETMKDINREINELSSILLNLTPVECFAASIPDHAVRCWKDSSETAYAFVVNKDCLSTRSSELILDAMTITSIEDVLTKASLSFYYEAGQSHIPLEMAPGRGRLLRIETDSLILSASRRAPREAIFSAFSLPHIPLWKDYFAIKPPSVTLDETLVGHIPLNGIISDISLYDGYAYVAALETGLHVVDVSNPRNPLFMETRTDLHYYRGVRANATGVYCADSKGGLVIFSPDEKKPLREIGSWWGHTGSPWALALKEDRAFLASDSWGMSVLDVADPTSPVLVGRSEGMERARCVIPNGDIVYVLDEFRGVMVEDVSSSVPVLLNSIPLSGPLSGAIKGNVMAIACGRYGLKVFTLEAPTTPVLSGEIPLLMTESVGFFRKEWIFAAAGTDGVALIHLDEEGVPTFVKFHQPLPGYYARALYSDNYCAYVLYPYAGLYILSGSLIIDPESGEDFQGFVMY
ncbi:hypothetical protein JW926_00155 [Candidatus Sumerlaeota bacterium]|nr:hypothetical protein [Candidatus Sumerlaeota bacterium]